MKKEIEKFNSDLTGYVKRQEYNKLLDEHEELKKENQHNITMTDAWKSQCGRF